MARTQTIPKLDLPPSIDQREVSKAAKQYRDLRERHRVESQNLVEAEHERDAAVIEDRDAYAAAIRAGRKDPGQLKTSKATEKVEAKRREVEALEAAATDAHNELVKEIEQHREAWSAKVAERIDERRAAVRSAIDAVVAANQALRDDLALSSWLDGFPDARYRAGTGAVPALRSANGDPFAFEQVVSALRETIDPPEQPVAPNVQPLRHIEHAL